MAIEKSKPITLNGGPCDGVELDVKDKDKEVRRITESQKVVKYVRISDTKFGYAGYIEK